MTEQLPIWNAVGVEPPIDLKTNGWQPGMKPSAQHMNWLFNRSYKVLEEFQTHASNTENPHAVTKSQVGLGSVENYGVATQSEAEVGTSTAKYMTPQRTKQAIEANIVNNLTSTNVKLALSAAQGKVLKELIDGKASSTDLTTLQEEVTTHKADYSNKFLDNAGAHNSIYRGKYLGSSVTAEQYQAISNGTFDDLYIGDYWTIGGVNYRIAGFNYFYNVGDTALTTNHVTIVPDTTLYNARMNATNITTGGYANSEMRTTNLASAISTIESAFAGHVVQHRQLLTNATDANGKASGWAWYDSKVELMNEVMVYGSVAWGEASYNSGYNVASSHGRLPLFALRQDMVNTRQSYWLRDVVSAAYFAHATSGGYANDATASLALGVRPAFSIS